MRPQPSGPFTVCQGPPEGLSGAAATLARLHRQAERDRVRAAFVEILLDLEPDPPPGTDVFFHADLPTRSLAELQRERARLRLGLLLHPAPPGWWRRRLKAVEQTLRR